MTEGQKWKGTTWGARWMHHSLVGLMRYLPLSGAYLFAAVFVIPFCMLFSHRGYLAQYHFFRRIRKERWPTAFWHTYVNHCRFAQIILDRFYVYAGGRFEFDIPNQQVYQQLAEGDGGFVVLSAHVGNYEVAGYALQARDKRFNTLVYGKEAETVMANRERIFEANNLHMIVVREDMGHLFEMNNVLADGESLSIPADRIFGSNRHYDLSFLGHKAVFPMGPFVLAAQHEVPVLTIHVMKTSVKHYRIYIKRLEGGEGSVRERARNLALQYAKQLEETVMQYPTQWFNYFEFWKDEA